MAITVKEADYKVLSPYFVNPLGVLCYSHASFTMLDITFKEFYVESDDSDAVESILGCIHSSCSMAYSSRYTIYRTIVSYGFYDEYSLRIIINYSRKNTYLAYLVMLNKLGLNQ